MTLQLPQGQNHVADLLPAYINGTLDVQSTEHVQQHLLECETCRLELATWEVLKDATQFALASAPLPSSDILSQVWAKIAVPPQQVSVRQGFLNHVLLHFWLVLKKQIPIIHKSIWIIAPLVIAFGCALTLVSIIHSRTHTYLDASALGLMTTVMSAASAAFIYGAENDTGLELTLSTPTSIRIIMFCRLLLVVGYNFGLSALASAIIALVHGGGFWEIVQVWLGPMLLLSSITLTLSLIIGSWFALLVGIILEATQAFLFDFEKHMPVLQLANASTWQTSPTTLLLAVILIVFAIFYAPRQPRLSD